MIERSAESTKWGQIVLSEDPNLKYIIPIFGHNLVNEDRFCVLGGPDAKVTQNTLG